MAKANGELTAEQKGKERMKENSGPNGEKKSEEVKKDKDGKPLTNGKKGEESQEGNHLPSGIRIVEC